MPGPVLLFLLSAYNDVDRRSGNPAPFNGSSACSLTVRAGRLLCHGIAVAPAGPAFREFNGEEAPRCREEEENTG